MHCYCGLCRNIYILAPEPAPAPISDNPITSGDIRETINKVEHLPDTQEQPEKSDSETQQDKTDTIPDWSKEDKPTVLTDKSSNPWTPKTAPSISLTGNSQHLSFSYLLVSFI